MLMRSFSRREKTLLVFLALILVVGLYVLLVQRPVEAKLDELALEKEDLKLDQQVAEVKLSRRNKMKKELDEIFALPQDQITVMPPYDNIETLMVQFNTIFMGLEPKLSFPEVRFEEGIATRPIQFEVVVPSYEQARAILTRLTRTGYRSLLDGLSITPTDGTVTGHTRLQTGQSVQTGRNIQTGSVAVEGTIYFYELAPETAEKDEDAEIAKAFKEAKDKDAPDKEGDQG